MPCAPISPELERRATISSLSDFRDFVHDPDLRRRFEHLLYLAAVRVMTAYEVAEPR